jgi:hypothetical protein
MGLGSIHYFLYFHDLPHETLKNPSFAMKSMIVVCLAALAFRLCSKSVLSRFIAGIIPAKSKTPHLSNRIRFGVLIAVAISIIVKIYFIASGKFGFISSDGGGEGVVVYGTMLSLLDQLSYIGVLTGVYYWFSGEKLTKFDKCFLMIVIVLLLLFALMNGMKAKVLHVILLIVIPAIILGIKQNKRLIPLRYYAAIAVLFFSFWAINPLIRAAMVLTQSSTVYEAVVNAGVSAGEASGALKTISSDNDFLEKQFYQIWHRVSLFSFLNSVVAQTGGIENKYRGWERYPYLPFAIVPRAIFPNKPSDDYSAQFNLDYISHVYNSTTPSTIGWAYMESGFISVILLMALLAIFYGAIDHYAFKRSRSSLFGVLVFGVFFIRSANLEPDPYWTLSSLPQLGLLIFLAYVVIFLNFKVNDSKGSPVI